MNDFKTYLFFITAVTDLTALFRAVECEVESGFFKPVRASNGALIIESQVFDRLVIPTDDARATLLSMITERLEKEGYPAADGWTPDEIEELEDAWERHKDD